MMGDAPLWQHLVAGLAALGAVVWLVRRAFRPGARKGPCARCAATARGRARPVPRKSPQRML